MTAEEQKTYDEYVKSDVDIEDLNNENWSSQSVQKIFQETSWNVTSKIV